MNAILNIFRKPSAMALAQIELDEARRRLLVAQTSFDYATAMVDFEKARVQRLEAWLVEARKQ
jgi:hypothetical protein